MRHRRVLLLIVLLTATTVFGAERGARPALLDERRLEPKLERITLLRPSPEAEVIRDFAVLHSSDGRRAVITAAPGTATVMRTADRAVSWKVDLRRGTYTTKVAEPTAADRRLADQARARAAEERARFRTSTECDEYAIDPYSSPCSDYGYWYAYATETWEPGAYLGFRGLTRTEAEVAWSDCSDGTVRLDRFNGSCWSNAYTFAATTWYTIGCDRYPPISSSSGPSGLGEAFVVGVYHNYDFGDDLWSTGVVEEVWINMTDRWASGHTQRYKDGEGWWLLSGQDFASGPHTRPAYCPTGGSGGGDDGSSPGGGDGGGGGGGGNCVPVYDGVSGEYLGSCCGETTTAIVDCAKQYIT